MIESASFEGEENRLKYCTPEVQAAFERAPIKLGEQNGTFVADADLQRYKIYKGRGGSPWNALKVDLDSDRYKELLRSEEVADFDPQYEYASTGLYLRSESQYENEAYAVSALAEVLEREKSPKNADIINLSPEEQRNILLGLLASGVTTNNRQFAFSGDSELRKDDVNNENRVVTELDFNDPLAKRLFEQHVFSNALIRIFPPQEGATSLSSIKNFFESLPEEQRIEALNFAFKAMLRSGHQRSYNALMSKRSGGSGLLADDRFSYLLDKVDKSIVEALWARDALYVTNVQIENIPERREEYTSILKETTDKLKIDPREASKRMPRFARLIEYSFPELNA